MQFSLLTEILQSRPEKKSLIKLFVGISAVILLGYALLFTVALLPQDGLRKNILQADSQGFFAENYPRHSWLRPLFNPLDMYTECVGVGIALNMRPDAKTLLEMPHFGECTELGKVIADNFAGQLQGHMRYIHGYQVVLKSMYTFFSLETVRVITTGTSLLLLFFLFVVLKYRIDTMHATVVVASFFLTASPNMFFMVTHAAQFWVVLTAATVALLGYRRICPLFFFGVVGAFDAFFSFLSMGSLSLALPLLCYTLAKWMDGESPDRIVAEAFWGCVGWSFGFALPWMIKWFVLLPAFMPTTVGALFEDRLELYPARNVAMIFTALQRNFIHANWPHIILIFGLLALRKWRMALQTPSGLWIACLPGLFPLLWVCILPGQSGILHGIFTNLILWPFLAACLLLLLAMPRARARQKEKDTRKSCRSVNSARFLLLSLSLSLSLSLLSNSSV